MSPLDPKPPVVLTLTQEEALDIRVTLEVHQSRLKRVADTGGTSASNTIFLTSIILTNKVLDKLNEALPEKLRR